MIISVSIVNNGRFVVKWTIVEIDESNDGSTFCQIFENLKAGLVIGIPALSAWPLQLSAQTCKYREPVETSDVAIENIYLNITIYQKQPNFLK